MKIKCLSVFFEETKGMNPFVDFYFFGDVRNHKLTEGTSIKQLGISLNKDKIYAISFDQSSSCSGVFIKDIYNTEIYMLEFRRSNGLNADDYIFEFEMLIKELTEGNTFMYLIYEAPIDSPTYRSKQVAFQLEGIIRQWVRRYEHFKTANLDNIEPPSWKSIIVDTSKYGADYVSKQASKESIIDLFPWAGLYGTSLYKDNDAYEAVGIMFGWFTASFDAFGRPYVRGDEYTGNVGCIVLPEVKAEDISNAMSAQGVDNKWFMYNPKFSTFKNIMKSARQYNIAFIQIEDLYTLLTVCIEANVKLPSSGIATLAVATPGNMSAAASRIIGDKFNFYL